MTSAKYAALALCLSLTFGVGLTGCDVFAPDGDAAPAGLAGVRAAIVAHNFGEAVDLAAAEVKSHPEDPAAHFEQARAEALAGNEGRALDALDKAITFGLPDVYRALSDPAFARISGSARFAALVDRASPAASSGEGPARTPSHRAGQNEGVAVREKPGGGTHIQAGDVVLDTDF